MAGLEAHAARIRADAQALRDLAAAASVEAGDPLHGWTDAMATSLETLSNLAGAQGAEFARFERQVASAIDDSIGRLIESVHEVALKECATTLARSTEVAIAERVGIARRTERAVTAGAAVIAFAVGLLTAVYIWPGDSLAACRAGEVRLDANLRRVCMVYLDPAPTKTR